LGDRYAGLPVFLTCDYCVAAMKGSLTALFEGMFDDASRNVTAQAVLTIAQSEPLHYAMLLLQRWPGAVPDLIQSPVPPKPGDPVVVISYPRGGGLAFSIEENPVVGPETVELHLPLNKKDYLFYRAPTEGGSSGGLVLNDKWEAVAMHCGTAVNANQGALLSRIFEDAIPRAQSIYIADAVFDAIRSASDERDVSTARYFSVFISYSHADKAFAHRLYQALQTSGIRAWRDEEQMRAGDDIYDEVQRAIQQYDKVLLCCSEDALTSSWWVDSEIDRVFQKERDLTRANQRKTRVVIPIDLDGYVNKWTSGKAQDVKSRMTADFSGWKDDENFKRAFNKLLESLRMEEGA